MATLVVTAFSCSPTLAQAPNPSGRPSAPDLRNRNVSQSIAIESTIRRYRVGNDNVAEESAPITYRLTSTRIGVRLGVGPLSYTGGPTTINGTTPFYGRLDYRFTGGHSIRVYGQSTSVPGALGEAQTEAIGLAGTPTLDLESFALGTPAMIGGRAAQDVKRGAATYTFYGGFEFEPRPGGTDPIYWRGSTVRGGIGATGSKGDTEFGSALEFSRSAADALDGRNLFPGGGTLSLSAHATGTLSEESDALWQLFGFYFRPFNSQRPEQPNRLIPIGDFMGVHGSVAVPAGLWVIWPAIDLNREASYTVSQTAPGTERVDGSGWTTNAGVQVTLPFGGAVDFTPGVGFVAGSVGASVTTTILGTTFRDSFKDPIRGWWVSLEIASRF